MNLSNNFNNSPASSGDGINLLKKNIFLLGLINFLTEFKLYAAIIILYFTQVTGSMTLGMGVLSLSMLSASLLELPTGVLSDIIGRKKTIVIGACASFISIILYAAGFNTFWLFAGAVLEGFSVALFSGNNDAFLYDHLKSRKSEHFYKAYLGKTSSMTHIALSVSTLAGSLMLLFGSYSLVFWLTIIPKAFCVAAAFLLNEPEAMAKQEPISPSKHLIESLREVYQNKKLMKLVAADSLSGGAGEAAYQFRATFIAMVWSEWAIGIAGTLGDVFAAFSFWISEKWINRKGSKWIILMGKAYSMILNVVSFILGNVFSPILLTSNALFYGAMQVAKNDMSQKLFTDRNRASMGSIKSLTESLAGAVLAVLIGWLGDRFGVVPALVSFQVFGVISLLIYIFLFKKSNH
ncbi:MAG: MFS transporter [Ruminiclostridium sp.]|nr:MFS transporter [Ruminiclostridium sp.]